ncbi:MAG: SBBP repeat-containing protein, partial [Schleiferiaceae bacterium]|nr:SBBP repeat-containing protein [Schleiferiaceae bacterium]
MRILFYCIALVFSTSLVFSQTLEWAQQFGGTGNNIGNAVAVDGAGNVYVTGFFRETIDFDPGPGTFNLTSAGNNDVYITKLDPMGNLLWAKRFGGAGNDIGFAIFVDDAGNVYTTGSFRGNVDFDPGPNTFFLLSDGEDDVFVSKLNTNGDFLWAKRIGGTGDDLGRAIVADNMGNVFVAGQFRSTVDFDPGPNTFNLSSSGAEDAFILKLNAIGDFEWARKLGSNSNDFCRGIALDASNNVHVIGSFRNTVTLAPNPTTVSLTSSGSSDVFVLKFNTNGNLIWAESFGGTDNDFGQAIAIDGVGNILTTGNFRQTADFNPKAGNFPLTSAGAADVFVSKLSSTGDLIWAKRFGGPVNDFGYGIGVDAAGNVYTTGAFQSTANFQTGPGFFNLTSGGWNDVYVSKLDSNGDFSWAQQFGGTADNLGYGIDVSGSGNVYTTGRFGGVINFDAGGSNTSLTTAGSFDVFVSKINQCPPVSGTDVQTACGTFT